MRKLSADHIFTLQGKALHKGVIVVNDVGTIEDILDNDEGLYDVEYFEGALCPGFINAHCHLELSHLRNKLSRHTGLINFIQQVQAQRNRSQEETGEAIEKAEREMIEKGIVGVGDISNSAISFLQKSKGKLRYHTFIEVFGFHPELTESLIAKAEELKKECTTSCSITPHAPYSVSLRLFKRIAALENEVGKPGILSVHNQESSEENRFYQHKSGKFVELYQALNISIDFFQAFGKTSLQSYLPELEVHKKLLVHNTFTSEEDILFTKNQGEIYWCLCPQANLFIENKRAPLHLFMKHDLKLTLGTDSLASNDNLCLLEEMKTLSEYFPELSLQKLLEWTCKNGANFFNWEEFGVLERGKTPGINLLSNLRQDEQGSVYLTPISSVKNIIHPKKQHL